MSTQEDRLTKALLAFADADDCPENRAKMKSLILEELPFLADADIERAIDGILGEG